MALLIALLAALPQFTSYVVDVPRAIADPQRATIEAQCAKFERDGLGQVAVAVVVDLQYRDRKQYAADLFRQWGLGARGLDDGLLILLVPGPEGHRGVKVEVGYGLEGVLPDGKVGAILDEVAGPALRKGAYGDAAQALVARFSDEVEKSIAAGQVRRRPPAVRRARSFLWGYGAWGMVLFAGWLLSLVLRERQPHVVTWAVALAAAAGVSLGSNPVVLAFLGSIGTLFSIGITAQLWSSRCRKCRGWVDETEVIVRHAQQGKPGLIRKTATCRACGDVRVVDRDWVWTKTSVGTASTAGTGSSGGGSQGSGGAGGGGGFSGGGGGASGGGGADREY